MGNETFMREEARRVVVQPWLEAAGQDLRYALRAVTRNSGRRHYAFLATLTLGLGVGGTTSIYCLARGLLIEPLPYAHERDVGVFWKKTDWTEEEFSYIRGRVPGFRDVALYRLGDVTLREGDAPARLIPGITASAELFDVLGAAPLIGRAFRTGDDRPGAEPIAVLSFGLWQQLGGRASLVGQRLTLDGRPRTVVGVMPSGFWFPDPSVRIWTPVPLNPESRNWNSTLIGRVAAGRDVHEMSAPVAQLVAMLDERFDYRVQWDKTIGARITPIRDDLVGGMRPALLAALGAMALILVIACANVTALALGQLDVRAVELAVRSALGADRGRLARQLAAEAVLVAIAAGAVGASLAWAGFRVLAHVLPLGAWGASAAPDWTVTAWATVIAVVASSIVALVPTLSLWRGESARRRRSSIHAPGAGPSLLGTLGRARTGGLGGRGGRIENRLVVAEVALAVVIASGAALLLRSVANLYAIHPRVAVQEIGVIDISAHIGLHSAERFELLTRLTAALAELPGVRSVAVAQTLPLRGGGYRLPLEVEGKPESEGMTSEYRIVTPGYIETMGIPLRAGRTISEADRRETDRVVVINEALARKYFAGVNPIGQQVGGDLDRPARVIGVVADAAERHLTDEPEPVRYVAAAQVFPWVDPTQSLVIRAAPNVDPAGLLDAARHTVERVAPAVAVQGTTTMRRVLDDAVGPARQVMSLLSLLTALALILGAVGVYGAISHYAARRRRDWAIRIALGLTGSQVVTQVVGRAAMLVSVGIGLGVLAATGLSRALSSLLYGVSAVDPFSFATASAALLAVGLVASLIPAWRAGTTDPAMTLRDE
jgi:predicted permease